MAKETDDGKKKEARRRFQDTVLALSKAFALAAASNEARSIQDEVAFFQAIRAALTKTGTGGGTTTVDRGFAVQQFTTGPWLQPRLWTSSLPPACPVCTTGAPPTNYSEVLGIALGTKKRVHSVVAVNP